MWCFNFHFITSHGKLLNDCRSNNMCVAGGWLTHFPLLFSWSLLLRKMHRCIYVSPCRAIRSFGRSISIKKTVLEKSYNRHPCIPSLVMLAASIKFRELSSIATGAVHSQALESDAGELHFSVLDSNNVAPALARSSANLQEVSLTLKHSVNMSMEILQALSLRVSKYVWMSPWPDPSTITAPALWIWLPLRMKYVTYKKEQVAILVSTCDPFEQIS